MDSPENLPIGLFDSGVGGLTVMREVARLLPNESIIYLGDTARVPYGTRSPEVIQKYTLEAASFLLKRKIKLLILACHTACSHAFDLLQSQYPVPIIGVTRTGLQQLVQTTQNRRVAILGTPSTIRSGLYQKRLAEQAPDIEVCSVSCPLFVPLIEEGLLDHPATKLIAAHYLAPLREKKIDTALLACTHYPLLRSVIQEVLGPGVSLIEPAEGTAQEALRYLSSAHQLCSRAKKRFQFYATDDPEKFGRMANLFFGTPVQRVFPAVLSRLTNIEKNKNL